ncbi:MAG TPA: hypothetical protein VLC09_07510 [Polyangiaceae bacterium]|nr:hypothetical protein [Polyangiaceae bacterium]
MRRLAGILLVTGSLLWGAVSVAQSVTPGAATAGGAEAPARPGGPPPVVAPPVGPNSSATAPETDGDETDGVEPASDGSAEPSRTEDEKAGASSSEASKEGERRGQKCMEVCKQNQACIHGRCVKTCSPACRPGTSCSPDGFCRRPLTGGGSVQTEDELARIAGAESAGATEAFVLDPGGAAFLGVQAAYERGRISAWVARVLFMNTGLMSYSIEPLNEFERFELGVGLSLGYRRYERNVGNLRGFFYGGGLLGQVVQVADDTNLFRRTTVLAGPYGEFGYRWVFGSLLFGFGPNLAIRVPLSNTLQSTGKGSCVESNACAQADAARFEGTLALEMGWLQ